MAPQPLTMDTDQTPTRKRTRRRRIVSSRTGAAGGVGTPTRARSFNSDLLTGMIVGYSTASNINPQQALYAVQHDLAKFGWNV